MGGSPKPPQQTDEEEKAQRDQAELMRQQAEAANRPIKIPKIKPPLPPPPPPTQSSQDVAQAEEDSRRKAYRRVNAGRGTLFAGETGGYGLGGSKTLLG